MIFEGENMSTFAFNFVVEEDKDTDSHVAEEEPINKVEQADRNSKENQEPDRKKPKTSSEDQQSQDQRSTCPYEKLAWADMIEECLVDAEIESVVCVNAKNDDEKVQLFSLHPSLVETRILALNEEADNPSDHGDSIVAAAQRRSDLVPRVYEGGLKIWECSLDLVRFLHENIVKLFPALLTKKDDNKEKGRRRLRVLELGCGAGLPGIWALRHPSVEEVHFQDYNRQVVLGFTMPNVVVNESEGENERKLKDASHFHSGDWSAMVRDFGEKVDKFDLILASETIYSLEDLAKFRDTVMHFLRPEGGVALIAAKEYYFGVGGGVDAFLETVARSEKPMKSETNWIEQHGVRRAIIELRF